MENKVKKVTKATVKSFVKKNKGSLYIKVRDRFDGMHDCCMQQDNTWKKACLTEDHLEHTLGISGAWFVGMSRDYFDSVDEDGFIGFKVYNSCGSFKLAIKNEEMGNGNQD